jgi:hypothetical protein
MNKILTWFCRFKKTTLLKLSFIAMGIASTVWFMVRVIPKPQRATYPCMRVAAPMMSGFVIYLLTLSGTIAAYKRARLNFKRSNYKFGILFLALAITGSILFIAQRTENAYSKSTAEWIVVPNQPIGNAK